MVNLLKDAGIETPRDYAYIDAIVADYEAAITNVSALMAREAQIKTDIGRIKADGAVVEAVWYRDGAITGGNAEQRAATLTLLRREDRDARLIQLDLERTLTDFAEVERALEQWRERRSLAKRRLDVAAAWLRAEAGQ